eukprot:794778-Pyramimonas_sp.AAC.3
MYQGLCIKGYVSRAKYQRLCIGRTLKNEPNNITFNKVNVRIEGESAPAAAGPNHESTLGQPRGSALIGRSELTGGSAPAPMPPATPRTRT